MKENSMVVGAADDYEKNVLGEGSEKPEPEYEPDGEKDIIEGRLLDWINDEIMLFTTYYQPSQAEQDQLLRALTRTARVGYSVGFADGLEKMNEIRLRNKL